MAPDSKKDANRETPEEAARLALFEADLRDPVFPENIAPEILESYDEVIQRYKSYSEKDDSEILRRAFIFAYKAHGMSSAERASRILFTPSRRRRS